MRPEVGRTFVRIEKKNPLKQGLKPVNEVITDEDYEIEKKNPLKQGLKLPKLSIMVIVYSY